MHRLSKASIVFGLLALIVVAIAYGARSHKSASDTLVFGSSADPVALDGALISDGESGRVIIQIYDGLVAPQARHDERRPIPRNLVEELRRR